MCVIVLYLHNITTFVGKKSPKEKQCCPGSSCSWRLINGYSHVAAGEQWVSKSTVHCSVWGSACHWLETNTAALSAGEYVCPASWMHKVKATETSVQSVHHSSSSRGSGGGGGSSSSSSSRSGSGSSSSSHYVLFTLRLWWTASCSYRDDGLRNQQN